MTHTDGEGAAPIPPGRDRSDAALDAAFSAASAGMVAAIRRGFDLDAGLARIVGAPPEAEIRSLPENTWKTLLSFSGRPNDDCQRLDPYICTVDVGTQIARLRFRVLDLVRQSQVGWSATVLLRVAASKLQDLHRGLEGKAHSRQAAANLLDAAGLALETASDVQASEIACPGERTPGEAPGYASTGNPLVSEKRIFRKRPSRLTGPVLLVTSTAVLTLAVTLSLLGMSWLRGLLVTLELQRYRAADAAVIVVNVAILGLLVFRIHRRLFRLFRRRSERVSAVSDAIKARAALRRQAADVGKAAAVLRRSAQPGDCERSEASTYVRLLHAVAKQQRPTADAATSGIDVLREELDSLRPHVMKLFDGADDRSPCAPC